MQALALAILLFPAAGGIFLGVFNWRGSRLLTAMVGPGVIWAAFDPNKQGWHDKIAGTYVVKTS